MCRNQCLESEPDHVAHGDAECCNVSPWLSELSALSYTIIIQLSSSVAWLCSIELLHNFSRDSFHGSGAHKIGRLTHAHAVVRGNLLFNVMGQEKCE